MRDLKKARLVNGLAAEEMTDLPDLEPMIVEQTNGDVIMEPVEGTTTAWLQVGGWRSCLGGYWSSIAVRSDPPIVVVVGDIPIPSLLGRAMSQAPPSPHKSSHATLLPA